MNKTKNQNTPHSTHTRMSENTTRRGARKFLCVVFLLFPNNCQLMLFYYSKEQSTQMTRRVQFDFRDFVTNSNNSYPIALGEIAAGQKRTHWIWYIFPQLEIHGRSEIALFYGIQSLEEAKRYLAHEVLGPRLVEISRAALERLKAGVRIKKLMGKAIDAFKLRSCATLFVAASEGDSELHALFSELMVLCEEQLGGRDVPTIDFLENERAV